MLNNIDIDGDGTIQFQEFVDLLTGKFVSASPCLFACFVCVLAATKAVTWLRADD
jgi:hypothetical protein